MTTKVMIVAGEASGDLHGSHLAKKLIELEPEVKLFGMGGTLMKEAGVRLLFNPTGISALGFVEVLKNVQVLRRVLMRLGEVMSRQKPDVLVVIDFPGFNMRLAEMAHRLGIPVVYYIGPSVWAWGRGRAKKVAKNVSCVCSIFPFEAAEYQAAGARVCYVGHPLLDSVKQNLSREEYLTNIGLEPERPFFALLPGSREQEIKQLLPLMLKASRLIKLEIPEAQFGIPVAHTLSRRMIESYVHAVDGVQPLVMMEGTTIDMLGAADAAIIAGGTATLEAAILGTPMVMVAKLAPSTYRIFKMLVKIKLYALPNIVAGHKVVEELIQHEATPEAMAAEIVDLWRHPERRQRIKEQLAEVVKRLGQNGASTRTAQAVLAVGRGEDPGRYSLDYQAKRSGD
ncbi:MAG TPA: lipid-A-disaccharide synthase [Firmicutes bacterium]|nr:lipid-A-disaccharide synthase [Bacillota bacterium]